MKAQEIHAKALKALQEIQQDQDALKRNYELERITFKELQDGMNEIQCRRRIVKMFVKFFEDS